MSEPSSELPPHDELADPSDQLGWDRDQFGSMADYAAPDDAVTTVPYDPAVDVFLED